MPLTNAANSYTPRRYAHLLPAMRLLLPVLDIDSLWFTTPSHAFTWADEPGLPASLEAVRRKSSFGAAKQLVP